MSKYPVFIISKGRHDVCKTAIHFLQHDVDFKIVIEPQEFELYKEHFDENILIQTPFKNLGLGSIPVRSSCKCTLVNNAFHEHDSSFQHSKKDSVLLIPS